MLSKILKAFPLLRATSGMATSRAAIHVNMENFQMTETERERIDEDHLKEQILKASLPYVHKHGWSRLSLGEVDIKSRYGFPGAKSVGLSEASHGLFPEGGVMLVSYFYTQCNKELFSWMQQQSGDSQSSHHRSTFEFLEAAVQKRLTLIFPYLEKWPEAMGMLAFPSNALEGLKLLGQLVDDMWHCAGDRSVDTSWYTKRLVLAGIYQTTELHLVQDDSPEFEATWSFLKRQMKLLHSGQKGLSSLQEVMGQVLKGGSTTVSLILCYPGDQVRNIIGFNRLNR
ncbi:unnamed protein product [Darwinula stevensoni]|uniref:Ubiquinone biosynthesis protein n=1 Tax=Darwinula stevensoni TaxID=69355 RepID=A0A7R8XAK9_9CRUS|nr:unnamed protein product [Darwinula stevensoni]CAG0890126.1 unnamed protein product [Darwinula stevensoni]